MIHEAIAFEISYWKRWKLNFVGSYLDSIGLLFAIILLMKFRSPNASITSPEYAFFIIGFLSSYLTTAIFSRIDTPKNYAKYDIYDWIVSSNTSMLHVLIAERIWVFLRYVTPGFVGLTLYFAMLSVSVKVYTLCVALMIVGWLGCVGFNFVLTSLGVLYGKIEGASAWLSLLISYFLVGIFFPVTMLPFHLWLISLIFPATYAIDLSRHFVLETELILHSLEAEVICFAVLVVVLLVLGLELWKRADRKVRQGELQF